MDQEKKQQIKQIMKLDLASDVLITRYWLVFKRENQEPKIFSQDNTVYQAIKCIFRIMVYTTNFHKNSQQQSSSYVKSKLINKFLLSNLTSKRENKPHKRLSRLSIHIQQHDKDVRTKNNLEN